MANEEMLSGFDAARQARYEKDLVERYGDGGRETIAQSKDRMATWTRADVQDVESAYAHVEDRLDALIDAGVPADDPRVLDVLDDHYATVSRFWTPGSDAYAELGDLYIEHPDFRARYDARHPGLAAYLRDAMAAYAISRLA